MTKTFAMVAAIAVILVCQANSMGTEEKENTSLRKLAFDYTIDKTFYVKTFSFLGQTIAYKYRVAVRNGKAINEIIVETNLGTFKFGNFGVDTETTQKWSGKKKVFTLTTGSTVMDIYCGGTLSYTIRYLDDSRQKLQMSLFGDLVASAELASGSTYSKVLADGTLISASGYATVTSSGITKGFNFSGTPVYIFKDNEIIYTIFEDWLLSF